MANITGTNRVTASFFSGTHAYDVLPFPHAGDMRTGMAFLIEPKDHDLVTAAAKHCESPAIAPS